MENALSMRPVPELVRMAQMPGMTLYYCLLPYTERTVHKNGALFAEGYNIMNLVLAVKG
jgi:hypothetical protein